MATSTSGYSSQASNSRKRSFSTPVSSDSPMYVASSDDDPQPVRRRSVEIGRTWTGWLKNNGKSLVEKGGRVVYGNLLHKRDEKFKGNAMHGLARSCTSFTYDELAKIIDQMPKEQLTEGDIDNDLPVHSAIKSMADVSMVSLFVQGSPEQQKKILASKNDNRKYPIEMAFESRQKEVIKKLFCLCVELDILPELTGIGAEEGSTTLLHVAFDENVWPWFLETIIEACEKYQKDVFSAIQVQDEDGYTPFEYLMSNCFPSPDQHPKADEFKDVVQSLSKYNIDIYEIRTDLTTGATMFHEAVRKHNPKCWEILQPLFEKNPNITDYKGRTPIARSHDIEDDDELESLTGGSSTQLSDDSIIQFPKPVEETASKIYAWKTWLKENKEKLISRDGASASEIYGDLINEVDANFGGTAMHGLARSCRSFKTEEMKRIISNMPKDQLLKQDIDGDLPVHSAINSLAEGDMVALFVQGDHEKDILITENNRRKTPLELAFDKRDDSATEKLFKMCVNHKILPELTGYLCSKTSSTLLHIAFERDDAIFWPRFLKCVVESVEKESGQDQMKFKEDLIKTIQVLDQYDCTPFYYLMNCLNPNHEKKESYLLAFKEVIAILINNEIDLSTIQTDSKKRTMLHEAERKNYEECSNILIENGHSKEVKDVNCIMPNQRNHHIKSEEWKVLSSPHVQCTEDL